MISISKWWSRLWWNYGGAILMALILIGIGVIIGVADYYV